MSILLCAAFVCFAAGAAAARLRGLSYLLAAAGSLFALGAAIAGASGETFTAELSVAPGLFLGIGIDRLSARFLLIAAVAWLAISLAARRPGKELEPRKALGFNLAVAGMLLVFISTDMIGFLVGWEIMTIFSFLMIVDSRELGLPAFRFLAFGELSQALLVVAFALLFARTHSFGLSARALASPAFLILASLGTIVKMDVAPFHTWMRDAYERLPGFAAALMSAGVTLTAFYGLERVLAIAHYTEWWTLLLVLLGAFSAFWGALQATTARTIRAVPAYSTVEYNGMILVVAALAVVAGSGTGRSLAYMATFAGAAAVVMALSHALAKSLFFLSLGETADRSGQVLLERLRGPRARFRSVSAAGLFAAALSFAAFPPLIGYLGEWMVLETAFQSYKLPTFAERFVASLSGVFVALAVGLAAFSMVRFIGYFLLGNEPEPARAHTTAQGPDRTSAAAIAGLALLLLATSIGVPAVLTFLGYGRLFSGLLGVPRPLLLVSGLPTFGVISLTMFAVVMTVLAGIPLVVWALRRRRSRAVAAWHGGAPVAADERFTPRAFGQILAHVMRGPLGRRELTEVGGRSFDTRDVLESIYRPFRSVVTAMGGFLRRYYMNGRIGWYVVYILVVFVVIVLVASTR